MMKFIFTTVLATFVFVSSNASDSTFVRLLLNNGGGVHSTIADGHLCTDIDWSMIDQILIESSTSNGKRRHLRSMIHDSNDMVDTNVHARTLQGYPERCKSDCRGQATGHCRVLGCGKYNRPSESTVSIDSDKGNATTTTISEPDNVRDLQVYPLRCKNDCRGYATGRCPVLGCSAYNSNIVTVAASVNETITTINTAVAPGNVRARELLHTKESAPVDNTLLTNEIPCTKELIKFINRRFTHLIRTKMISKGCQAQLKQPRRIACYHYSGDDNMETIRAKEK